MAETACINAPLCQLPGDHRGLCCQPTEANRARVLVAELLRQPADEEPMALARADEALFALHRAGFELVAVAGPGHVVDVPVSASEPNPLSMRTNPVMPVSAEPPHSATAVSGGLDA